LGLLLSSLTRPTASNRLKAEEARAALYAKRDQLIEEQLRAKFKYGRLESGEVA
jgi:hypothetical protein